jgi:hypothetical protein
MPDTVILTESNFILYAAAHYNNPQCYDIEEFNEDLKRFKYVKRLINKYIEYGDLKERLILNHIIALNNVFNPSVIAKMLFVKLEGYEEYLLPFLNLLGCVPMVIYGVGAKNKIIITEKLFSNKNIEQKLREI